MKKEGARWLRRLAPRIFLANFGDFLKNLGQKGVYVRPLCLPSGSAPGLINCLCGCPKYYLQRKEQIYMNLLPDVCLEPKKKTFYFGDYPGYDPRRVFTVSD